jgi:hypothetical protein
VEPVLKCCGRPVTEPHDRQVRPAEFVLNLADLRRDEIRFFKSGKADAIISFSDSMEKAKVVHEDLLQPELHYRYSLL